MTDSAHPPHVLLLHGIPTNAALWRPVLARLNGMRAIAPDLPGYGDSAPPPNPSIVAYHRFISDVLTTEQMRAPILVGHDLGGLYALTYAIAHPHRLRALVLLNTTIYPDPRVVLGLIPLLAPGFGEAYAWLAGQSRYRALHQRELAAIYPVATPDDTLLALTEPYGHTSGWLAVLRSLRGLSVVRVLLWLRAMPSLELPVLILWGEGDPYFPATVPERLCRDLPGARLQYVPHGGHFPMLSHPELVASALTRFARSPNEK